MPNTIIEIYSRNTRGVGEYAVRVENGSSFTVYAKDELDAYTKALAYIKEKEKEMRVVAICFTLGVLFSLSLITFACEQEGNRYTANLKHCVAAGKNYVRENNNYSCRDANANPKGRKD